jgi:hypothetical protein
MVTGRLGVVGRHLAHILDGGGNSTTVFDPDRGKGLASRGRRMQRATLDNGVSV